MLYNDAYAPVIASKHPRALGGPGREIFPEVWDTIGPMLASVRLAVRQSGQTIYCWFWSATVTRSGRREAGVEAAGGSIGAVGLIGFATVLWGDNFSLVLHLAAVAWTVVASLFWWTRERM
jgi:hypothetical protein